ncbi:MAG: hypothetical protein ABI175_04210 [Polyangiales bacterium]
MTLSSEPPDTRRSSLNPARHNALRCDFHEALSGDPIALVDTHRRRFLSPDRYLPFAGAPQPPPPLPTGTGISQESLRADVEREPDFTRPPPASKPPPSKPSGEYRFFGPSARRRRDPDDE